MAKELTNSEKRLQEKQEEKAKLFLEEVNALQEKYNLRIIACMNYYPDGIVPALKVIEVPKKPIIKEAQEGVVNATN